MSKTFYLPDLGEGLASAEIRQWFVKEGDAVTAEQTLCAVETAKALVEVPSPFSGVLKECFAQEGQTLDTGAPLCTIHAQDEEVASSVENHSAKDAATVVGCLSTKAQQLTPESSGSPPEKSTFRPKAMPAIRAYANKHNIDLTSIHGSGPEGEILLSDLPCSENKCQSNLTGLQMHRQAMFHNMTRAHQHVMQTTIFDEILIDDTHSLTIRILMALKQALSQHPLMHATFDPKDGLRQHDDIHVGLAVHIQERLYVPVIKKLQTLDEKALQNIITQFKHNAQQANFRSDDLEGGQFVLSNFGIFGAGTFATPVVVPPGLAILGMGKATMAPVWCPKEKTWQPQFKVPLSLSFDHRLITGGEAAAFLAALLHSFSVKRP